MSMRMSRMHVLNSDMANLQLDPRNLSPIKAKWRFNRSLRKYAVDTSRLGEN